MGVSLIIPHRDRWEDLNRCLGSVAKMSPRPEEVIVVDDFSSQYKDLEKAFPLNIRMLKFKYHRGTAIAKNEGSRLARGDYLWFLDSDSEVVMPYMLELSLKKFRDIKKLGALGGEGVWDNKEERWRLKLKTLYPNCDTREKLVALSRQRDFPVDVVATCNLLIPRWLFESLGGFFRGLKVGEDKEFCQRIRKSNYLLIDSFDSFVAHHASIAAKELRLSNFFFKNHTNQLAAAVLILPFKSVIFLPFTDIVTKYIRFRYQSREIRRSALAAHGPQARLMGDYRKTFVGRVYLYLVFALVMPFSYLYTLMRLPYLFLIRIKNRRLIQDLKRARGKR